MLGKKLYYFEMVFHIFIKPFTMNIVIIYEPQQCHSVPILSSRAAIPCINNDFRLVGGSETSGRVEVCVDGVWRKVCGDSLGNQTSAKICEHIGLKGQSRLSSVFCLRVILRHYVTM